MRSKKFKTDPQALRLFTQWQEVHLRRAIQDPMWAFTTASLTKEPAKVYDQDA